MHVISSTKTNSASLLLLLACQADICNVPAAVVCVTNLHLPLHESSGLVHKTGKDV